MDGLNNKGFSAGPVVASDLNSPKRLFSFVGVNKGIRTEGIAVSVKGHAESEVTVATNTGILLVVPIERAIDLIAQHKNEEPETN